LYILGLQFPNLATLSQDDILWRIGHWLFELPTKAVPSPQDLQNAAVAVANIVNDPDELWRWVCRKMVGAAKAGPLRAAQGMPHPPGHAMPGLRQGARPGVPSMTTAQPQGSAAFAMPPQPKLPPLAAYLRALRQNPIARWAAGLQEAADDLLELIQ